VSADLVLKSKIRIDVISNLSKENILFDSSMYAVCIESKTLFATVLRNVFSQPVVIEKLQQIILNYVTTLWLYTLQIPNYST